MRYIKIILTIIAVLLSLNVLARCFVAPVGAQNGFTDVNLVRINGYSIYGSSLPVTIE